ncbi:Uncharacterised protein [Pseudomonas putida]|nr:Uncharacterised protein [Pseudomonas putida]
MHQAGGRGHLADRGVDALDEAVERRGQLAELVLVLHRQAAGQVAFAFGDVLHGAAHGGQRTHEHRDEQAQQAGDGSHGDEHGDDRRGTELAQCGVGFVFVDGQTDVPLRRRQAFDRSEGDDSILAVEGDVLHAWLDLQGGIGVDVLEVLHQLVLVGADDDLAVAIGEEGVADAAEVHGVDDVHQGVEAQVTADHTQQLAGALGLDRHRDGDHQTTDGRLVGRGQHGLVGGHRGAIPRPLARVVAIRHLGVRTLGEHAIVLTEVGELEVIGVGRLVDQAGQCFAGALLGDVLGEVLKYQDASGHPVLHAAGSLRAGLANRRLDVLADDVALQVVVVEGEQGKCQDDHGAGAEQDLVAEFQVHVSRPWTNEGRTPHAFGAMGGTCHLGIGRFLQKLMNHTS